MLLAMFGQAREHTSAGPRTIIRERIDMVHRMEWMQWQSEIVKLLRGDFLFELQGITAEDIDWVSWQDYYVQGKSARQAIDRALERDL